VALAEDEASLREGILERSPPADQDGGLAIVGVGSLHPPYSSDNVRLDVNGLRGRSTTCLESNIHADRFQGCVVAGLLIVTLPSLNTTFLGVFGRELMRVVVPGY
jgi:hypothetical protein